MRNALFSTENNVALLTVAAGGEWFQLTDRPRVLIEKRESLRRLLLALAHLRNRIPNNGLTVMGAFEAGWPELSVSRKSAAMSVYTAIHSLRDFGLRNILIRRDGRYFLDVDVRVLANESQFPADAPDVEDIEAIKLAV